MKDTTVEHIIDTIEKEIAEYELKAKKHEKCTLLDPFYTGKAEALQSTLNLIRTLNEKDKRLNEE